jgi:phage gp46-like protein
MSDVRIKYFPDTGEFDLDIKVNEIENDEGLETAVLISLFSDARCEEEELPEGETSRRGFWGDAVENPDNIQTGSKLWVVIERAKTTDELLEEVREFCEQALEWLIDDMVADSVTVETSYLNTSTLNIEIEITRPDGRSVNFKYNGVWEARERGI